MESQRNKTGNNANLTPKPWNKNIRNNLVKGILKSDKCKSVDIITSISSPVSSNQTFNKPLVNASKDIGTGKSNFNQESKQKPTSGVPVEFDIKEPSCSNSSNMTSENTEFDSCFLDTPDSSNLTIPTTQFYNKENKNSHFHESQVQSTSKFMSICETNTKTRVQSSALSNTENFGTPNERVPLLVKKYKTKGTENRRANIYVNKRGSWSTPRKVPKKNHINCLSKPNSPETICNLRGRPMRPNIVSKQVKPKRFSDKKELDMIPAVYVKPTKLRKIGKTIHNMLQIKVNKENQSEERAFPSCVPETYDIVPVKSLIAHYEQIVNNDKADAKTPRKVRITIPQWILNKDSNCNYNLKNLRLCPNKMQPETKCTLNSSAIEKPAVEEPMLELKKEHEPEYVTKNHQEIQCKTKKLVDSVKDNSPVQFPASTNLLINVNKCLVYTETDEEMEDIIPKQLSELKINYEKDRNTDDTGLCSNSTNQSKNKTSLKLLNVKDKFSVELSPNADLKPISTIDTDKQIGSVKGKNHLKMENYLECNETNEKEENLIHEQLSGFEIRDEQDNYEAETHSNCTDYQTTSHFSADGSSECSIEKLNNSKNNQSEEALKDSTIEGSSFNQTSFDSCQDDSEEEVLKFFIIPKRRSKEMELAEVQLSEVQLNNENTVRQINYENYLNTSAKPVKKYFINACDYDFRNEDDFRCDNNNTDFMSKEEYYLKSEDFPPLLPPDENTTYLD